MKSAKIFLYGMYLHLILSIAVPIAIVCSCIDGWSALGIGMLLFYWLMTIVIQITGWVCAAMSIVAYQRGEGDNLLHGWKLLKIRSIPFYIVNFVYSFLVWFVLVGASRGIMILLVPIPVIFTCTMIVQSGCVGICYIMYLRNHLEQEEKPSRIHYIWQLMSIADIVSTMMILKKYGMD